jgi:cytoskeletal protein CcmA (bactofilin family)
VIGNVRTQAGEAGTLWVGEQGCVEGAVDVPNVVLNGTVKGDVHASDRVVIGATARITGSVHYGTIEMALGAQVAGKLIPMNSQAGSAPASRSAEPAGRSMAAELPPAAVDALFDARKSGT